LCARRIIFADFVVGEVDVKRILLLILCIVIVTGASGCNTVRGMGKDIEKAGDKIQDVAD
jgi:predicted small secreted protein